MAFDDLTPKLFKNTALAALAGFVATFGAFLATTPKPTSTSAIIAAAAGAAWGAVRLAAGTIAGAADKPLDVDK